MPVAHLILHAYGTWMPDHPDGYWHHQRGQGGEDRSMAAAYRGRQQFANAVFDEPAQAAAVRAARAAAAAADLKLFAIASDSSHLHLLVGWEGARSGTAVRRAVKRRLTQELRQLRRRPWLSKGGRIEPVEAPEHFDHLYHEYLPSHNGLQWRLPRKSADGCQGRTSVA